MDLQVLRTVLMDKVSIIIALYNVSGYLRAKQLDCILHQTYRNLEIILVNDGSTDDTFEVCQQLASQDERIVIISKQNGGSGSARNAGLDVAKGDYVWFYDVDDEVETNLIEKNVEYMNKFDVDLVIFSFEAITPILNLHDKVQFKSLLIKDNSTLKSIFVDELLLVKHGNGFTWNKFYRKSFIDKSKIRFGNQQIQQDELFNLKLYPSLDKAYISSDLLYKYYIYDKSATRCHYIENRFKIFVEVFNGFMDLAKKWDLNDERLTNYAFCRFYFGIENSILYNTFHKDSKLSLSEKKSVTYNILNNPMTKKCFAYMSKHNNFNTEQRLYYYCFLKKLFMCIICLNNLFKLLRGIKRFYKRLTSHPLRYALFSI
jgi:glycosyltransferase involved in cell wall biosynthesis